MRGRCIVDRQNLDDLHPCGYSPIDEVFQITEIAHAVRTVCTQRKDRYSHTGSTPSQLLHPEVFTINYQYCSIRYRILVGWQKPLGSAVITLLPCQQRMGCIINNHIFIFDGQ